MRPQKTSTGKSHSIGQMREESESSSRSPARSARRCASALFAFAAAACLLSPDEASLPAAPRGPLESTGTTALRRLSVVGEEEGGGGAKNNDGDDSNDSNDDLRPVAGVPDPDLIRTIHAFYEPVDDGRGYSSSGVDPSVVDAWREAWEGMGWETRVLTAEDAKSHPDYEEFAFRLDDVPMGKYREINRRCYLRYLAIASVGGGWMSDIDIVPTVGPPKTPQEVDEWNGIGYDNWHSTDLTEGGPFVSYSTSSPALMRASSTEWTRVAWEVLETAEREVRAYSATATATANGDAAKKTPLVISDRLALLRSAERHDLRDEVVDIIEHAEDLANARVTYGGDASELRCGSLSGKRAVHFSRSAMAKITGRDPWEANDQDGADASGGSGTALSQAGIMKGWSRMYRNNCVEGKNEILKEGGSGGKGDESNAQDKLRDPSEGISEVQR